MKQNTIIILLFFLNLASLGQSSFQEIIQEGTFSKENEKQIFGNDIDYFSYSIKEKLSIQRKGIWLRVEKNNGVCHTEWLYVFSDEGDLYDKIQLEDQCDNDGSRTYYKSFEGNILGTEPIIEIIHEELWVKDTTLYEVHENLAYKNHLLKKGINFHDNGMEYKEIKYVEYYSVDDEFKFEKILKNRNERDHRKYPFTYHKLLKEDDLLLYSRQELRIMRNEVFADYGYIFKSEDLQSYFLSQSWYKPLIESIAEVSPRLNILEQKNIATIQRVELTK